MDPVALVSEIAGAVPAVGAAIEQIKAWLRVTHPELDLTPLGGGDQAQVDARAEALRRGDPE